MEPIFIELTIVLILGVIVSGIMRFLKQPLIIGYILTGIIVSPNLLNIIKSPDAIGVFAKLGIVLLLFLVGLSLNPKTIKDVGRISVITGVGQVLFTTIFGFLLMTLFGFDTITSIYVAVAITFSSTIIIMKLLTDKNDLDTLYGKISVGFLIVQDIIAMFILILIATSSTGGDVGIIIVEALLKGFALLVMIIIITLYVVPSVFKWAAKSQEFLLMLSIAWCLTFAGIFQLLNFSMEVGALIAGVTLAPTVYRQEIGSKLRPLRDFFLVIFFITLGAQMTFQNIAHLILPIVVISLFILIGNPLIVMILLGRMKFSKRTGFMSGLTVAQISEFSLILIGLGVFYGHIDGSILSFVTIIGLITIGGSTYMIMYASKIYPKISKFLSIFERKAVKEVQDSSKDTSDVILFGYHRIAHDIMQALKKSKSSVLIVDYNPDTITELSKHGINCKYGDANDLELLNELNFKDAKMVVSTIPELDTNLMLIKKANSSNGMIITIAVSHQIDESLELYDAGATYVVMPHFLGGTHTSMIIEKNGLKIENFLQDRLYNIENLKNKKVIGHEHPSNETKKLF